MYRDANKKQSEMTASPEKYPQGFFKEKGCKRCGEVFQPNAPSHMYCSEECKTAAYDDGYLMRTYGITLADYEELLKKQDHKCAVCGSEGFSLAKHKTRETVKLVVDHCHDTKKVRGLLCHNCNRALGLMQDSTDNLQSAIQYLEGATTIPKGSTLK